MLSKGLTTVYHPGVRYVGRRAAPFNAGRGSNAAFWTAIVRFAKATAAITGLTSRTKTTSAAMARIVEKEEIWLRHRVRRMRAMLRYATDPRVESGLRELIGDAEDRLEALQSQQRSPAPRSAAGED